MVFISILLVFLSVLLFVVAVLLLSILIWTPYASSTSELLERLSPSDPFLALLFESENLVFNSIRGGWDYPQFYVRQLELTHKTDPAVFIKIEHRLSDSFYRIRIQRYDNRPGSYSHSLGDLDVTELGYYGCYRGEKLYDRLTDLFFNYQYLIYSHHS